MIKAVLRTGSDDPPILILGLSGENMTRLMAREPIQIELDELDLPAIKVVIVGGRTEEAILAELRQSGLTFPPHPGSRADGGPAT